MTSSRTVVIPGLSVNVTGLLMKTAPATRSRHSQAGRPQHRPGSRPPLPQVAEFVTGSAGGAAVRVARRWGGTAHLSGSRGKPLIEEGRDSLAIAGVDIAWSQQQLRQPAAA